MRSLIGFFAVAGVVGLACSSSSSGGGTPGASMWVDKCNSSGAAQTCTGGDAYGQCLAAACDAELKAALGTGYATGSFNGPCGPYMTCGQGCACGAGYVSCQTACQNNVTTACDSALNSLSTCINSAGCTSPHCTTTGGAGGSTGAGGYMGGLGGYMGGLGGYMGGLGGYTGLGGSTGLAGSTGTYTCAQLSTCCAKITDPTYAPIKNACTTTVGYAVDQACSAVYTTYLTYCP